MSALLKIIQNALMKSQILVCTTINIDSSTLHTYSGLPANFSEWIFPPCTLIRVYTAIREQKVGEAQCFKFHTFSKL